MRDVPSPVVYFSNTFLLQDRWSMTTLNTILGRTGCDPELFHQFYCNCFFQFAYCGSFSYLRSVKATYLSVVYSLALLFPCFSPINRMDPTNGVSNFFEKDKSMTYKRVAVFDNRGEDLLQHLASCISFIEQVPIYLVRCRAVALEYFSFLANFSTGCCCCCCCCFGKYPIEKDHS